MLEVGAEAEGVELPHGCGGIPYELGTRGRERLRSGEMLPVTARCRLCGGRVFFSLLDPAARAARDAAVLPDTEPLRAPKAVPGRPALRLVKPAPKADPCPACGVVPDEAGLCRCSA